MTLHTRNNYDLPPNLFSPFPPHLESLGVVDQTGEDNNPEHQEEDEQREFLGRSLEGVDEDLESPRVPREFEESQDANDAEELYHLSRLARVVLCPAANGRHSREEEKKRKNCGRGKTISFLLFSDLVS